MSFDFSPYAERNVPAEDKATVAEVANALRLVADAIEQGVKPETLITLADAYGNPRTLTPSLIRDLSEELVAQRDHGSRADREHNRTHFTRCPECRAEAAGLGTLVHARRCSQPGEHL